MAQASRLVLDGFEIRTDTDVVRYPHCYMDAGGVVMWGRVMGLMADAE
jgi:DNA polymerase-1